MRKTKILKRIGVAFIALIVLALLTIMCARIIFDYDIFDRSGWTMGKDGDLRYLDYHGQPIKGWQIVDDITYYFDPQTDGAMRTGWIYDGARTYYLDENGKICIGFTLVDNKRYYFDLNGCMHLGWLGLENESYYFDAEGILLVGWLDIEGDRYYFGEDGRLQIGWQELSEGRFYFGQDGKIQKGWVDIDDCRFYLDENGGIKTGLQELPEGLFYFDENGAMQSGWLEISDRLYYLTESGAVCSGWVKTGEGVFYIAPNGCLYQGWLKEGEHTYYFKENGQMHIGWLELETDRYYFLEDGTMAVGRVEVEGKNCYFTSTGKYFVLVNPWNTVPDDYELELVWFDGFEVDASCYDALVKMRDGCLAAGRPFTLTSAYRGVSYQTMLFQNKVDRLMANGYTREAAERETGLSIAIPGTSEHHLGLAVDIKSGPNTYDWLASHSWEYGFIMRYPIGATELTGIYYEPWHFRYVGQELAKELFELGICVEEYFDMLTEKATAQQ